MTHRRLNECTGSELLREIVASRETLERELGVAVQTFAYPYGDVTPRTIQCVRDQGYLAAVGVGENLEVPAGDLFALSRITFGYAQNMPQFVRKLLVGSRKKPVGRDREPSSYPRADQSPL